jgi:hypothetical protein
LHALEIQAVRSVAMRSVYFSSIFVLAKKGFVTGFHYIIIRIIINKIKKKTLMSSKKMAAIGLMACNDDARSHHRKIKSPCSGFLLVTVP